MIGVVAHDAGAAEIISSYLRRNALDFAAALEGPAVSVFARKFPELDVRSVEDVVAAADWLLLGTSFPSDFEWLALQVSRSAGKPTVSVIDHWTNYRPRFARHGEWHFPDLIWVGDTIAERIAQQVIPEVPTKLVPNAYFQDIQEDLARIEKPAGGQNDGLRLLYLSQPTRTVENAPPDNVTFCGYTEDEALRYFLSNVGVFGSSIARIDVRPHPREAADRYAWAVDEYDLPISTGRGGDLLTQIAGADIVAGCATMAMVVGLLAKKRVVSCIPPGGQTTELPHPEIERLQDLLRARKPEAQASQGA